MQEAKRNRILGAVLAGGLSSRFGSDKGQALLDGRRLLDHAVDALAAQCETVIIVGREEAGHMCVPDWPRAHMGPLGGIAGALRHAVQDGYDAVLTCGVDSPHLPANLLHTLFPAPAYVRAQPVIGLWPATALTTLEEILNGSTSHAVRHFAERIDARQIELAITPDNVNTPNDLEKIVRRRNP